MEAKEKSISYFAHEGMMARMERTNVRLWIVILVLLFSLIGTNLFWIIYESQYEYYDETYQEVSQSADGTGARNYFAGGDVTNGEGTANSKDN